MKKRKKNSCVKEKIVIAQNEAAIVSYQAGKVLCTFGITKCIAIVIRGDKAFALIHAAVNTHLDFISKEIAPLLGNITSVKLYKWVGSDSPLDRKICETLPYDTITIILGSEEEKMLNLEVNNKTEKIVDNEILKVLEKHDTKNGKFDFGPNNPFMRAFKQSIHCYLNPHKEEDPWLVYEGKQWHDTFELDQDDLAILYYLYEGINHPENIKQRIMLLLEVRTDKFKNDLYLYRQGNPRVKYIVDNLPLLIEMAFKFADYNKESFGILLDSNKISIQNNKFLPCFNANSNYISKQCLSLAFAAVTIGATAMALSLTKDPRMSPL